MVLKRARSRETVAWVARAPHRDRRTLGEGGRQSCGEDSEEAWKAGRRRKKSKPSAVSGQSVGATLARSHGTVGVEVPLRVHPPFPSWVLQSRLGIQGCSEHKTGGARRCGPPAFSSILRRREDRGHG